MIVRQLGLCLRCSAGPSYVRTSWRATARRHHPRVHYATVSPSIIAQPPPASSIPTSPPVPPIIDNLLLTALSKHPPKTDLKKLIKQYIDNSGTVLDFALPYESRPSPARRTSFSATNVPKEMVVVAHCADAREEHKITLSSGFALEIPASRNGGENLILTCAHTLEEIRRSPLMAGDAPKSTGSFVITGSGDSIAVHPISGVASSLPRSDLLLLSCQLPQDSVKTLPASPYPVHGNTSIRAHFVAHEQPRDDGWTPWVQGTWSKWVQGKVMGYRDFAGRDTKPGTYDTLSHMLFMPLPTAGSSGGPIIDEESGSVVGVMLGTRMDNRIEGVRGWGVPSETIFEMFTLPGLEGKK